MNVDKTEIDKFQAMASQWWEPNGPVATLHALNPFRFSFVSRHCQLKGKRLLDIGCGGGIFAESLARAHADVTALDQSEALIRVAKMHAISEGHDITYLCETAEAYAVGHHACFDVITCMELLEHVPQPDELIQALAHLLKPGGQLFISTIARNTMSYVQTIIGAEYLLRLLPIGTHDYEKFVNPSELSRFARAQHLDMCDLHGFTYNPITRQFRLTPSTQVNYMAHLKRKIL